MDYRAHNRRAWDLQVAAGNPWTIPASPEAVAKARLGDPGIVLTPLKTVPMAWYPPLKGCPTLCLASGGGQQGPLLAAAGAVVTVLDNSPGQLDRDREVAQREHLNLTTVLGDMEDLSPFADGQFSLIVHPVSNIFTPHVARVWQEAARVLAPGGVLLAGLCNPVLSLFDPLPAEKGQFILRFSLPYSDIDSLTPEQRAAYFGQDAPVEWSHTLELLIGGQMEAGLALTGFYEDYWGGDHPIDRHLPVFFATRAVKSSA